MTSRNINEVRNELESKLVNIVDKYVPMKQIRIRDTRKPWITNELLKNISAKKRIFKQSKQTVDRWNDFKTYRNSVKKQIQQSKKAYYTKIINETKQEGNKTNVWDIIKQLFGKAVEFNDIKELTHNGITYNRSYDIAQKLNTFFSTIGTNINSELQKQDMFSEPWKINRNGFEFTTIDEITVKRELSTLSNNKKRRNITDFDIYVPTYF